MAIQMDSDSERARHLEKGLVMPMGLMKDSTRPKVTETEKCSGLPKHWGLEMVNHLETLTRKDYFL